MQSSRKELNKKNRKPFYKHLWIYFVTIPIVLILVGSGLIWHKYGSTVQSAIQDGYTKSNLLTKNSLSTNQATVVYDNNGQELQRLNTASDLYVTNDNTNPLLRKGFVAVEDKRFYQNTGVDLYGTLRSIVMSALGKQLQGGSTITQQLARNRILKSQEQTISRKISEMVVAQNMTEKFSKKDILTGYLNTSYFGHGAYGVAAASKYYFNKDQKDLTVRESALVVGLTNNPTLYDPTTHPKTSNEKVKSTLLSMYTNGAINKKQYQEAINSKTELHITPITNDVNFSKNYAVSFAVQKSAQDLAVKDGFQLQYLFKTDADYQKYHKAYNQAIQTEIDKIIGGGYHIYTSIDSATQDKVQSAAENVMNNSGSNAQVALTVVDNQTHNIAAVVGGRSTDNDYFNRAYQSYRQPGSTAKPLVAYTTAFEQGDTPQSTVSDTPLSQFPSVHNYSGSYSGNMTIRNAVVNSLNLPALRDAMKTPINTTVNKLAEMQFSHLAPEDNNYIIAIGGFTNGVTTTEMAGAYSTLVNQGMYYEPSNVLKITSADSGMSLYTNSHDKKSVYSPSASYMMLDVMKSVGSGPTVFAPALADNYPHNLQAVKTGQTDGDKDVYFVHNTAYYSTAVWVGNDNGELLTDYESSLAMRVNKDVQTQLLAGKAAKDFTKPSNVTKNGDNLYKTANDDVSVTDKTTELLQQEQKRVQNVQTDNQNRLNDQDYRILYGLSKNEETKRENKVQETLENIDSTEFTNINQYEKLQSLITKAKALNNDVKHQAKVQQFNTDIDNLQQQISNQYSYLLLVKKQERATYEANKINAVSDDVKQSNASKIQVLQSKLEQEKKDVVSAYKTGSKTDQSNAINALQDTISTLNKYGEPTASYKIYASDNNATLIQEQVPTVSFKTSQ